MSINFEYLKVLVLWNVFTLIHVCIFCREKSIDKRMVNTLAEFVPTTDRDEIYIYKKMIFGNSYKNNFRFAES